MFIVSRECGIILNFNNIVELYTGSNKTAVAAKQVDGRIICLKEYDTEKEAREAIRMIADEMNRKDIVDIPKKDEIKAKINLEEQKWHHATGKKTKGHGGS